MERDFTQSFNQLNVAQKQAVEKIDGPVLVIAGPGTGKTQLLSLRVANILKKTDTDPSSILCLTFTNFAATNMRDRLAKLVGPAAQNVSVRTFHSFASELMQLFPDYFWNGASLKTVPDAVQLEIIQTILSDLPLDNPLSVKFADNYTAISDVMQALKLAKEAGLTPQKLAAMIAVNDAYIDIVENKLIDLTNTKLSAKTLDQLKVTVGKLPDQPIDVSVAPLTSLSSVIKNSLDNAINLDRGTGKTTNTGAWKRRWIQSVSGQKGMYSERKRNAWWKSLTQVYGSYRSLLHSRGYYDYSDMIIEVNTQLEQNPDLLASVQEKYLYVLIDEFQDVNAAQLRLAHLVSSHYSNEKKPNLMAVGDDDQSIFAFNGAELNNMLNFTRFYPSVETIVLKENYRSTQEILDNAQSVISYSEDRLVNRMDNINKELLAASKVKKGEITHFAFPTMEQQLSAIATHIKESWTENSSNTIAVLARSHDSLRRISAYLNKENVPLRYEQQNNILNYDLIQLIFCLSKLVVSIKSGDEKSVNYNLSLVLTHPVWNINTRLLWKMATADHKQNSHWMDSVLNSNDTEIKNIGEWLLWLSEEAQFQPLPVMTEYILGLRAGKYLTSPLNEYFIKLKLVDNDYLKNLSALNVLNSLIYEFVATRQSLPKLEDFVRFYELNNSLNRTITDESWFVSGEKAVQLMTIHKSKGLEFDCVYLLNAVESEWQPKHFGRKPPANLPLQPYGEHLDDYARLAYVASTRSKSSLIISSYELDGKSQKVLASPFFSSIPIKSKGGQSQNIDQNIKLLQSALSWPRLDNANEKTLLTPRINEYTLSATGLLQFLDITNGGPMNFLEKQLLKLPSVNSPHMAYGNAVHKAMEAAQNLFNRDKFDMEHVLSYFDEALEKQLLPINEYQRYHDHGRQVIKSLFQEKKYNLTNNALAEVSFDNVVLNNATLKGALDNVYLDNNKLIISDYKTGASLKSFSSRSQSKAIKAWRHKNQLLFYVLLARQSGRYKNVKRYEARIIYVEAEDPGELVLSLIPDEDELKYLERLISSVWKKIKTFDLPDTTKYSEDISGILEFQRDLLK